MSNCLLQNIWKKALDPSLVPAPYLPLYSPFWVIKNPMGAHQIKLYKTSLSSRGKNATIKDFKLQILFCFNSPITEH